MASTVAEMRAAFFYRICEDMAIEISLIYLYQILWWSMFFFLLLLLLFFFMATFYLFSTEYFNTEYAEVDELS